MVTSQTMNIIIILVTLFIMNSSARFVSDYYNYNNNAYRRAFVEELINSLIEKRIAGAKSMSAYVGQHGKEEDVKAIGD